MTGRRGEGEQRRRGEAVAAQTLPFSSPLFLFFVAAAIASAIGLAPLPRLLAAIGLVFAVALPLLSPALGAALAVLSVPAQELVALPGGLSLTQAAVLLVAAGWGLHVGTRDDGRGTADTIPHPSSFIPRPSSLIPWLVFLWVLLLSASLTPFSRGEALKETARWGVAFLVWLVAATSVRRRWELWALVACLLLAPAATALIGLWQFVSGDGPPSFRIAANLPFVRAYGTIGQPNSFAGYMNMAWPLALALAIANCRLQIAAWRARTRTAFSPLQRAGRWALTVALCGTTLLLLAGLLASFSRGAWLGALAGMLGLAATLGRRWALGVGALLMAGVLALALGGAGLLPTPVATRLASISRSVGFFDASAVTVTPENFAAVERMAQVQAGWRMLLERPLIGVGPGNYNVVYPRVAVGEWYISRGHAHNYYLHIAAEAGLLGLGAYLALVGGVAWRAVALARRARGGIERAMAVGCCGMIAAVAGHNLFENLHVLNMGIQLAATWALIEVIGLERSD